MESTPLSARDVSALVDSVAETIAEAYERDATDADWLAVAEAARARVGAPPPGASPRAATSAPDAPAPKRARAPEEERAPPAAPDAVQDSAQVNAAVASVKAALVGACGVLPESVEVVAVVRKRMADDYGGAVFHGTVLATKDYLLTAPAKWRSDWCKLSYEESITSTAVGSVYHASPQNAYIIDKVWEESALRKASRVL